MVRGGGSGESRGEARGPSWRGRIKGVEGWRGFNLRVCVRLMGGCCDSAVNFSGQ
jgi:hypothetical protein